MPSLEEVIEENGNNDTRKVVAQLGVNLVGEVLDEACTVVNTAQRVGWFKNERSGKLSVSSHADLFEILQGDNDTINENKEVPIHVTTSTPHKDEILKTKPENSFIGQGDEEIDMVSKENEVHDNVDEINQDAEELLTENEAHVFSSQIMRAVIDKLVETAFLNISQHNQDIENEDSEMPNSPEYFLNNFMALRAAFCGTQEDSVVEFDEAGNPNSLQEYCYSFLENACDQDARNDTGFCVDEDTTSALSEKYKYIDIDQIKVVVQAEIHAELEENVDINIDELSNDDIEEVEHFETEKKEKLDAARYEDAYLTLNRDYEQCSQYSDDGDPILQDPKTPMQEVELLTASTEEDNDDEDNSSCHESEKEKTELAAISAVSGASESRKSRTSLISRCRTQGARLLSCLRGWWRRKTPAKRKEPRAPGSIRGICSASPYNRRRASSLLCQRRAITPVPSRSVVWKFNTINEALVNSTKWKQYTFEVNPEDCENCDE